MFESQSMFQPCSVFQQPRSRRVGGLALVGLLAFLWLTPPVLAQPFELKSPFSLPGSAKKRAKPEFITSLTPAEAKPGDIVTLSVRVKLPPDTYIYSAEGDFGARTRIQTTDTGLEPVDAEFSADHEPKTAFEPLFSREISKFYDEVTWSRKYKVLPGAAAASLKGTLEGQYCTNGNDTDGGMCVPIVPAFKFSHSLTVAAAPAGEPAPAASGAVEQTPQYKFAARPVKGKSKTNPAEFTFDLAPSDAQVGEIVTLSITAKLDEGWHTFSLDHVGLGGIATAISLERLKGLTALDEAFQESVPPETLIEGDYTLRVHHKAVTWSRRLRVTEPEFGLEGVITWQTCNNGNCLPEREYEFVLPRIGADIASTPSVAVTPNSETIADPVPVAVEKTAPVAEPPMRQSQPQDKGLIPFILTAIGFGFVSLLTPCVFPMVPITVSFFLKQSEKEHSNSLLLAIVYGTTIVLTFTVIGVGVAAVFGAAQLNSFANGFWVNAVIGTVFVVFGLNMLGMFEIRVPSWLLMQTATRESAGGYLGAIFMALTFTLTSFTCTFAFAGSLLVAAAQGEIFWPVVGMAAFGAAFASPFFVLALLPRLLKQLPKSGGWMNTVKVVMGLIEIGAAVKFFSVADPSQLLFDHIIVLLIWGVLALVTGLYLLGQFRLPHDTPVEKISVFRLVSAMGFLGLAVMLSFIVFAPHAGGGGMVRNLIVAFAPLNLNQEDTDNVPGPEITHHGITFGLNLPQMIPYAESKQLPLFLDFTGVNCVNCRQMEVKMAQPEWRDRLRKFAGVQLYVDTSSIPKITDPELGLRLQEQNIKLQEEWFGDVTMPAYAIVSSDGKTVFATYNGAETAQTAGTFTRFLDDGYARWQTWQKETAATRVTKPASLANVEQ